MIHKILSKYQALFGAGLRISIVVTADHVIVNGQWPVASGLLHSDRVIRTFEVLMAVSPDDIVETTVETVVKSLEERYGKA